MWCWEGSTLLDAAQFYEEVRGSDILNTLKLPLHYSERRGIHSVMYRDSKRRQAHWSSKHHVALENWICWPLSRIVGLLHFCLFQPKAKFGDSVCKNKVFQLVASSVGPFEVYFWGLLSIGGCHGSRRSQTSRSRQGLHGSPARVGGQIWVSATGVEKQLRETYPAGVEFSTTSDGTKPCCVVGCRDRVET